MDTHVRAMTLREKAQLILFVLAREWVLVMLGFLVAGISLTGLLSQSVRARMLGALLALLLLVAMGLYVWIKVGPDLKNGQMHTADVEVREKQIGQHEATTAYYLISAEDDRYEVSRELFDRILEGQIVRINYTGKLRVVLHLERPEYQI